MGVQGESSPFHLPVTDSDVPTEDSLESFPQSYDTSEASLSLPLSLCLSVNYNKSPNGHPPSVSHPHWNVHPSSIVHFSGIVSGCP